MLFFLQLNDAQTEVILFGPYAFTETFVNKLELMQCYFYSVF